MSLWLRTLERGKRLVIAHRGARSLAPENTLAAARKAFDLGADGWELDIRLSADLVPMVIHDGCLLRTSNAEERHPGGQPWETDDFDCRTLQELDQGSWFCRTDPFGRIAAGEVGTLEQEGYKDCRLPTLAQALELTKASGRLVNVEIKDLTGRPGHGAIVEKALEEIRRAKAGERVLISSFNPDYLKQAGEIIRRGEDGIPLALLLEIPAPDTLAPLREAGAGFFHPRLDTIPPEQVAELARAGIKVQVWTVNQPALMEPLWEAGAVGVITDFPQLFTRGRQ